MSELKAPSLQSLLESDRGSTDSLLAESLQLDFEDLDDAEFAIPPTDVLPTLEAVLSEFEADSDVASELGVPVQHATPTPSIGEDSALRGDGRSGGGSIMRYTLLHGISAQLTSAGERVNAGAASACAVAAYIAVGTSHGHILNFDVTQTLRWAHQDKHGHGAVSSLAFNADSTRLLAGYARGLVAMLDTHSGDVLRELFDVITPNTGVLHVKWTSRSSLALCADAGGSVWSLSFTRKLGIRGCSSRCLFSGARGEVCAVEPLIMDSQGRHELDQYCIVALATLSKYFIVTVRPRLRVIKYHVLQGPPDCLPLLAWHLVLIQAADTSRSVDPVIVVGRGNQLFFHQLFVSNGRITLLYLRHVQLHGSLLSAHWLGPKCVASLDTSEILHLVDVRSSKELECMDMANAGLVYGSAQFKGLATGGNVSPAFALAGSNACYNSVVSRGTQLYVLGAHSLHIIGVRTWSERISYLVKHHRWQEACQLALDGYVASVDRPRKRAQAKERIIMLFREYIANSARAPDYCLGSIVNCLITIGELELLWTQLWEKLQGNSRELFLQHISEHIERETIQSVNPLISQALVDYWLERSPAKLEKLILKLDWMCLDLNQVLKAVKRHRLYRAQIYLNTQALGDYTAALTELLPLVTPQETDLGNCLLVYVSSCLAGRGYPTGDIPAEQVQQVKHDVLRCLTSQHSKAGREEEELPYPYLRALLKFDTRETLNVISLAFQEREFSNELGLSHRKRIIYLLLEIMTPENAAWAEIGCLLNFIAQQISMQCLPRDRQLLQRVLSHLAQEHIEHESSRQHSERESAWHELLSSNCLADISSDEEQLALAERARCYYVVEYLLEKLQRYENILDCYIQNESRHETMFAYMERHVSVPGRCIYPQLKQHLRQLLTINAKETTRLLALHYPERIMQLLESLLEEEALLFCFLKCLNERQCELEAEQMELLLELFCKLETTAAVEHFLATNCGYRLEQAIAISKRHRLNRAVIYLYEKQESYAKAFELSMDMLRAAAGEQAVKEAQQISALLSRSVEKLPPQELERCWFTLLQYILPHQELQAITKAMLHEASQHIDLHNLVQLIMNTPHNVNSSFGDIKDLLMGMLDSSRHQTEALRTAADALCQNLHVQFARQQRVARRGLWITSTKCCICRQRLSNQTQFLVMGCCGHALHEDCLAECPQVPEEECPRCYANIPLGVDGQSSSCLCLPKANRRLFSQSSAMEMGALQLKAPPRRFC
ncbi:vacuolar protein sorting-associated protein 8 homolog [Drosophila guanche]|uniref:Blast:Vacuolar protein sorting-associated protein 8 homolog n=1 Tax=Drosophila guanche TaxID=7266 RepID=A0A3B0JSU6_DROGU|nr:vacuolar protein sorting-associated protein 8 homolog [Drosophila guanche]XP_034133854.1 vacuolar protein sorting-associated protein 8 homolog [Drosophila guanche]SPP85165.1 blast:Vacuolar protein sorting-associated protein 8 homolog [Drosophila guanche]